MKIASRVAFGLSLFLLAISGIYWFTAYEATGAPLILIAGIGFAYIGLVARAAARRAQPVPAESALHGPEDVAAQPEEHEDVIAPTIWPFGFSLAMVGLVLGVVVGPWLLVPGGILFVACCVGWYNDVRRQHAPAGTPAAHQPAHPNE